jgi:hypothetical protein
MIISGHLFSTHRGFVVCWAWRDKKEAALRVKANFKKSVKYKGERYIDSDDIKAPMHEAISLDSPLLGYDHNP